MNARVLRWLGAFGVGATLCGTAAIAQDFDPTRQLRELNEPEARSVPRVPAVVIAEPGVELPAGAADATVVPSAIHVEGNTALDAATVESLSKPHVGRPTSLREIYALAAALTRAYRESGYALSEVIVPPQRIEENGVVRLQAIEGYVAEIRWPDDREPVPSVLRSYLEAVTASRPLSIEVLERALLLANDVPGHRVRATLVPSEETPGAAVLAVTIERTRWTFSADADNSGTESVGTYRGGAYLAYNGLMNRGEQTSVFYALASDPKELQQASLTHTELLGRHGTQLQLSAHWSEVRPGGELAIFDIRGELWMQEVSVRHPLIRLRNRNLTARVGFGNVENRSKILGVEQIHDSFRYAFLNLNYDFADAYRGVTVFSGELRQGLDIFDANTNSRVGAQPDFTLVKFYAARNQTLSDRFSLYTALFTHHAFDEAPSSEEPAFGGSVLGRGYDRSEITGDYGAGVKVELRYAVSPPQPLRALEFYSFWDLAATWDDASGQPPGPRGRRQSIASIGAGTRFRFAEWVSGHLELAQPLTKGVASEGDDRDLRFNFELRVGR